MFSFIRKTSQDNSQTQPNGLSVSFEDLVNQQRYLPYLSLNHNLLTSNQAGEVKSAFKGRGIELEEVREYIFGDDIRDIDWRVTARKSEPYTKVYSEEKDREITVLLDLSATMVFGTRCELKSVAAAKITALLGWLSIRNHDRFGVLIYDGAEISYFKPQNNMQNLMTVFNRISAKTADILSQPQPGNLADALRRLQLHQKGQGTLFILSDFYGFDNDKFKNIAILAKKQTVYCINIFDVIEELAPTEGTYAAEYQGQKVVFNTQNRSFVIQYQQHFAARREILKKNCQNFFCKYIEIRTDYPIFKQLRL